MNSPAAVYAAWVRYYEWQNIWAAALTIALVVTGLVAVVALYTSTAPSLSACPNGGCGAASDVPCLATSAVAIYAAGFSVIVLAALADAYRRRVGMSPWVRV